MNQIKYFLLLFFCYLNGFSQGSPTSIMVVPSDNLLYKLNCLDSADNQGQIVLIRQYEKAFTENTSLKSAITAIGTQFNAMGLELKVLETELKALQNRSARNSANRTKLDPNTALMRAANPDVVLELSYEYKEGPFGNSLTFILDAIDAYSYKSIASISHPGIKTSDSDIAKLLADQIEKNSTRFLSDLSDYALRLQENGREVSVYLQVGEDSDVNLLRDRCGDRRIGDVIQDWMRKNTVKGSFKRDYLTDYELAFSSVRIPKVDEFDQGIQVNEWLIGLTDELNRTCKRDPIDLSTGLGNGVLLFE